MIDDNPRPIKDYHVAFARAVVALAREHGVGQVKMEFRRASSMIFRTNGAERWDSNEVSLYWHEGRHGATSSVELKLEARASALVPEKETKT
jgi:hypothetical protein